MIKKTEIQVLKNEIIEKDEIISKLLLSLNQIKTENILEVIHNEVYEKKLRVFNAKYRAVIETLEIGITIQDENLNIIDANKSAGEILGLSIDQMQGRSSFDPRWRAIHVDGSDYPGETHPTVITMRTGQPLIDQIMGVHKPSGELTWISINTIPMWGGDNGEQNGVVVFFKDITATKKNQEEKIRNQKLLLESESIGKLGGWELDLITNQLYWTDETYKIHETTPKEYTPTVEKSFDFYLEESKNQLISAFEVAKTSGIGYDLYLQIKTEQGNIKDVRTTCKITFKENIPIKLTGIIQDITKQKKLEYNLKEEKEKYKLLFNNNPIPLALFDAESLKFLNVNEAFCKQYGYNYDEFSNMSLLDIKPEDEFELVKEMVKKVDTEVVNIGVFRHRKKNNEVIKVEIIRHEIIYEGKRAKLVLVNDVTEKLKIEEEIKIVSKSALDFKNAVFSASIISIADKKGLITFVNKNFIDISGFSEIELIGKNHRIINSGVHSKEFWQDMWQTILSGKTWRNEVKNRAKDGTYYWVDTFIIPFIDDDGEITQLLSIRNDITEKKNSELELILNKKAVESALEGIVITDASLPDNPIIYSNERFTIITGYSKEDVYGKNCRFLQGAETDPELIKK